MDKPIRIQRQRTRGWRMPPNTVYVGRPSFWGNPFVVGRKFQNLAAIIAITDHIMTPGEIDRWYANDGLFIVDINMAIEWYRKYIEWTKRLEATSEYVPHYLRELRGKNLACWCPLDQPCHADVLLKIANS